MYLITQRLRPGWSVGYELSAPGGVVVQSWGTYVGVTSGSHVFEFRLRTGVRSKRKLAHETRLFATLQTTEAYVPTCLDIDTQGGRVKLCFYDGTYRVSFPDGTTVEGAYSPPAFVLIANMIPMLAIRLALEDNLRELENFQLHYFSPELLEVLPYSFSRRECDLWITGSDEEIRINAGLLESLKTSTGIIVARIAGRPRWNRLQTNGRSPRSDRKSVDARQETAIQVLACGVKVDGALVQPPAGVPCIAQILFLGGSGRHDVHGRTPLIDLGYRQFMMDLARRGIGSLRMAKASSMHQTTTAAIAPFQLSVEMARAGLQKLREASDPSRTPQFIVGHSEGGLIALVLAGEVRDLSGIALLATAGRPVGDVILNQVQTQSELHGLSAETRAAIKRELNDLFSTVRQLGTKQLVDLPEKHTRNRGWIEWLRSVLDVDPTALVAAVQCPLLIVQGEQDIQVSMHDAERLATVAASNGLDYELTVLPGHDHVFHRVDSIALMASYTDRRRYVSKEVVDSVAGWIRKKVGRACP